MTTKGRATRVQYISHHLGGMLLTLVSAMVFEYAISAGTESDVVVLFAKLVFILSLVFIICDSVCITVKRFHDLDKPGTHYWLLLIPIYNIYLECQLLFKRGVAGPNKYDTIEQEFNMNENISEPQGEYFCSRCNLEVKWGDKICQHCGDVLEY